MLSEVKRKTDLLSYLPNYLKEYTELKAALEAENPEFDSLWKAAARVLSNFFILTADEYGMGRYEKLLGIYPEPWLSLEERREIVLIRWFSRLPYTYRMLLMQLGRLCEEGFKAEKSFEDDYYLGVETYDENWVKALEIRRLMLKMVPANIRLFHSNTVQIGMEKKCVCRCGAATSGKKVSIYAKAKKFEVWRYSKAEIDIPAAVKVTRKETKVNNLFAGGV